MHCAAATLRNPRSSKDKGSAAYADEACATVAALSEPSLQLAVIAREGTASAHYGDGSWS
ncbi:Transcription termination factor rho [Mesorhizobium loti]|nr:Transcription termination factor rho [Mesorhizobium loti]